ncbi:MAG TPA: CdaR family protein, partial [Candidatus Tumulicola sp.]|nr:CdaR family protein [Candidatus Tumulicola sp.]
QIIRKNFTLKLLALGLALVGWAYLRFAGNPIAAARFAQQISVPITSANLPVGYVAHFTEREAVVTVEEGHGDPPVKPDDVKAVLDLANKGPGVYNVPITLVAPAVAVQSLSPASVTLTVERIETRAYPPSIHYSGNQPEGVVVAGSQLQPKTVSVSGATTMLAQVAAVQLDVAMPAEPKTLDEMVRPVAVNSSGQEVAGLVVSPDLVRVQVHFAAGRGAGNP